MWLAWIIAYYAVRNDFIIPKFSSTVKTFFKLFADGAFWIAFLNTFLRTLLASLISFLFAAATAAATLVFKPFENFVKPVMALVRTLPTLAVILIILLWTSPRTAPVVVTFLVLYPVFYSGIMAASTDADEGLFEMAKVFNVSKRDMLFKIYLPKIAPSVLSQFGANVSLGLKVMISAEVLAGTFRSMGGLMQNARLYLDMPKLAALTLISVILGLLVDILFSQTERVTYKWRGRNSGD